MNPALLVRETLELVTFAPAAAKVLEQLEDPNTTAKRIAEVLGLDPTLAARVLRIANSPFFLTRGPVDELERAVAVLGTDLLRDIVLGASAITAFDAVDIEGVSVDDFWRHSLYCGALSAEIAQRTLPPLTGTAFTAGLVHDIGQLVMFVKCPGAMRRVLDRTADEGDAHAMNEAERAELGFDHSTIGAELARAWRLPSTLQQCMAHHHDPGAADAHEALVAVVHIANSCAVVMETGDRSLEEAPPIHDIAWERARIGTDALDEIVDAAHDRFEAMQAVLID